jgi:hypothetical protein
MKKINLILNILLPFLLTGCSSEPSESNMLSAVQNNENIKNQMTMLVGMANRFGEDGSRELPESVKQSNAEIDCKLSGRCSGLNEQSEPAHQSVNPEQIVKNILKDMVLEKSDCVEANGLPGFICDFRIQTTFQDKKEWGKPAKGRFFKTGDDWNYEEVK